MGVCRIGRRLSPLGGRDGTGWRSAPAVERVEDPFGKALTRLVPDTRVAAHDVHLSRRTPHPFNNG